MARNVTLSLDETPWERLWQARQIDRVECYCKIEVCSLSHQSMPLEQCSVGFTDSMSPEYRLVKGQPINHSPSFRGSHVFPIPFFQLRFSCFTVLVVKFDLCTHTSTLMNTHMCIRISMLSHFNTIQFYLHSNMCPSIYEGWNLNLSFFLSWHCRVLGRKKEREKKRAVTPHGSTFWSVFIGPSSGVLRVQALPRFLSFVLAKVCQMPWAFVRQAKTTHRILSSVSNGWEGGWVERGIRGRQKANLQRARALQSMVAQRLMKRYFMQSCARCNCGVPEDRKSHPTPCPTPQYLERATAKRRQCHREWKFAALWLTINNWVNKLSFRAPLQISPLADSKRWFHASSLIDAEWMEASAGIHEGAKLCKVSNYFITASHVSSISRIGVSGSLFQV